MTIGPGPTRSGPAIAALTIVLVAALSACSTPEPKASNLVPGTEAPDAPLIFVALGGDETVTAGEREVTRRAADDLAAAAPGSSPRTTGRSTTTTVVATTTTSPGQVLTGGWAHRVFARMPTSAVHVDLTERGATAAATRRARLPRAIALQPTVVAVWLGPGDQRAGTTEEEFRTGLAAILDGLVQARVGRILVLTRPAGDPGGGFAATVEAEAAIRRATVVRLPITTPATGVTSPGTTPGSTPGTAPGTATTTTTAPPPDDDAAAVADAVFARLDR